MMQTDVKSGTAAAASQVRRSRRIVPESKALALTHTAAAGTVTITDGNGGATLFAVYTCRGDWFSVHAVPRRSILAQTGIYTATSGFADASATVFYG
jgi:hypothetical protein